MRFSFSLLGISLALVLLAAPAAFAIEDGAIPTGPGFVPPPTEYVEDSIDNPNFREQALNIVNYFLTFLGFIAILALIYFGFRLVLSGGDEKVMQTAKTGILYVALGIILILLSYAIVQALIVAASDPPLSGIPGR